MPKKHEGRVPEGQTKYCEGCGKKLHVDAKTCPHCGHTSVSKKSGNKTLAIVGLILNIFVLPGLGTLIGGDVKTGIIQIVLVVVSIPLMFVLIGIPLLIGVWIWALVSSINQIKKAED